MPSWANRRRVAAVILVLILGIAGAATAIKLWPRSAGLPAIGATADNPTDLDRMLNDMQRTKLKWNTSYLPIYTDLDTTLLDAEVQRGITFHIVTLEFFPKPGDVPAGTSVLQYLSSTPRIDNYLGRLARLINQWTAAHAGHTIILRPLHEANGDWYPWGFRNGHGGNTPAQYVTVWDHFRGIMDAKAPRLKWFWCPNRLSDGDIELGSWYPGDKHVDYVGHDGYNQFNVGRRPSSWQTPSQVHNRTIIAIRDITQKPYIIGETATNNPWPGVSNDHSKRQWFSLLGQWIRGFARSHGVIAVMYFDYNRNVKSDPRFNGNDWRITSGTDSGINQEAWTQATKGLP